MPHSKSKLSGPDQNALVKDKMSNCLYPSLSNLGGGWVNGWDFYRKYYHFVAPSYKLELARFSVKPKNPDGAECVNTHVRYLRKKLKLL